MGTDNFLAFNVVVEVVFDDYVFAIDRVGEAGPAGAGIKFCIGREQFNAADRAKIVALLMAIPIFAAERSFCVSPSGYIIKVGVELFFFILFISHCLGLVIIFRRV